MTTVDRLNSAEHLQFIIGTQAFLEAYRAGATVEGCEDAMRKAGYEVVPIKPGAVAALDVVRLAAALDNVGRDYEQGWTPAHYARAIAVEYAKLTPSGTGGATE